MTFLILLLAALLPAPTLIGGATRGQGGFRADDFNSCGLNTRVWSVKNQTADLAFGNYGAGSANSDLTISISGATTHDPWNPDTAPVIYQPAPSGNFTVEVKFDSALPSIITGHGIEIMDSAGKFLRFDVFKNSSGYNAFSAFVNPGVSGSTISNALLSASDIAPLWLRVVYSAGTWDYLSSSNGTTFTRVPGFTPFTQAGFTPAYTGILVANEIAGNGPPAYTAKIDYWNTTTGAPSGEDATVLPTHTLTVNTTGSGTGSVALSPNQTAFACPTTVTATASPAGGSVFGSWSGDITGTSNPISFAVGTIDEIISAAFNLGGASPVMSITPTTLSQSVSQNGSATPVTFSVANTGGGTLDVNVSSNVSWATVAPLSASITTTPQVFTVSLNSTGLAIGNYSGIISVSSTQVATQTIPVNFTINPVSSKLWPDGATDTGLNAPLPDLGGQTCQSYCGGNFPAYTGSYTPAAGATIECKTANQKFTLQNPNITIRCNDLTAPGDNVAVMLINSANATNYLVEGNEIHDSQNAAGTCWNFITIYDGSGEIRYNHFYRLAGIAAINVPTTSGPITMDWNYEERDITGSDCGGTPQHTESIYCGAGNCGTFTHNKLVHTTDVTASPDGTAAISIQMQGTTPITGYNIDTNFISGGGDNFYIGASHAGQSPPQNILIKNNMLGLPHQRNYAFFDAVSGVSAYGGVWANNTCQTTGNIMPESDTSDATGCSHGFPWPSGSTDTGFNAPLASLGGQTCQQFCGGSFPAYVGPDIVASNTTIQCKTITQGIKLQNVSNITLRCDDISAPGDNNGVIKTPSGYSVSNLLIEGNVIHDGWESQSGNQCGVGLIVLYQASGMIQWNDMYSGSSALYTPGNADPFGDLTFQWNYWHDSIGSWKAGCGGAHTEGYHCEAGCAKFLHNKVLHSTLEHGYDGTAAYNAGASPSGHLPASEDVEYNLFQGGAYAVCQVAPVSIFAHNTIVGDTTFGAWHFGAHCGVTSGWSDNHCTNGSNILTSDLTWNEFGDPQPNHVCNHF